MGAGTTIYFKFSSWSDPNLKRVCRHITVAKKDVQDLLKASGVTADDESLTVMMNKLKDKSIPDLIKEGSKDLAAMPAAGGAAAGGAAAATTDATPAAEEKPKEEEEE